ncbi:GNAT family N-acetyltransferase [Pseudoalteromonas mariniglutinosa]|uniref:GNAT family N-acetyltransferase n=1 Tax=Pseudoalteromonas mariniglutinosa TaxID=206042 RepID=UPI00384AC32F
MNVAKTPRLNFRLMDENDAELLLALDSDPQVMQYLTRGKISTMETIKTEFMPRLNRYRNVAKGWGLWQVNITASEAFIGWILIRPMGFFEQPDFSDIEIGWRFKRASWGNGYAIEAAHAVLREIIKNPEVKTISASALAANIGSIKVMEKLGLKFVKAYQHRDQYGELPAVLYSCLCDQLVQR